MSNYGIEYEKGFANVKIDIFSRNLTTYLIQPVTFLLDIREAIKIQEKDNVCYKNCLNENGLMIMKKKGIHKIIIPMSLRKKLLNIDHKKFGNPDIRKLLNLIFPNYTWPDMA